MADYSISDFPSFINQQIKAQEQVEAYLWRLEALITVAVTVDDFYDLSESILHNYFSIVDDLIKEAEKANQSSLGELLKRDK